MSNDSWLKKKESFLDLELFWYSHGGRRRGETGGILVDISPKMGPPGEKETRVLPPLDGGIGGHIPGADSIRPSQSLYSRRQEQGFDNFLNGFLTK